MLSTCLSSCFFVKELFFTKGPLILQRKMRRLFSSVQRALCEIYPLYFQHMVCVEDSEPEVACKTYMTYMNTHTSKYRKEITKAGRGLVLRLHEEEARLEQDLKWMKKVVSAYAFHRRSADRQKTAVTSVSEALEPKHILCWMDFKQNLTVPLAFRQTSNMFWAQARMEVSIFGLVVHVGQAQAGGPRKLGFLVVSPIIEHTALAAALQVQLLKGELPMDKIASCHFWMDCGGHFRTLDMCSYVATEWASSSSANIPCTLSWFGEKHGKGEVDGLFSCANRWIQSKIRNPGAEIASVADVVATLRQGAAEDMRKDPSGMIYKILEWNPEKKPTHLWKGTSDEVQIRKTYCLTVKAVRSFLQWQNHVFSDAISGKAKTAVTITSSLVPIPEADREWRRGHFLQKKWAAEFPTTSNALMNRHEELSAHDTEIQDSSYAFNKKIAKYERQLANKRKNAARKRGRLNLLKANAADSSSSSSTSSESGD